MTKVKEKIIIRSSGEFKINKNFNVYSMNLQTGEVRIALLIQEEDKEGYKVFRIKEESMHIYIPAPMKDVAVIKFKNVLNTARK